MYFTFVINIEELL